MEMKLTSTLTRIEYVQLYVVIDFFLVGVCQQSKTAAA